MTIAHSIIPRPASLTEEAGSFSLAESTNIYVQPGSPRLLAIGHYLADRLRPATGYPLAVLPLLGGSVTGHIVLELDAGETGLGDEGYSLVITEHTLRLTAYAAAGLFHGVQTIRQLLPAAIERRTWQPGAWCIPCCTVRDVPRFSWRGAMLDVARHFFALADVKAYIDVLAFYKLNRFHLHLSDDQGWRIDIRSWPRLAGIGGSTAVGGGPGGYYTQEQYREIVAYADSRYITVVPEIDMPGHTMAALASYPELSREGIMPSLYTGVDVGVSSLNTRSELTYQFVEDVIREVSEMTSGPYFHVGGDEAFKTRDDDYIPFIERVQDIVQRCGKVMVGWEEIAKARLCPDTIVQFWNIHQKSVELAQRAVLQGARVIMSPASRAYLDQKYDANTPLGLNWAGFVQVQQSYEWDPATLIPGLQERDVMGTEAPLWSETTQTLDEVEYLAFPRLPGINEAGWSPVAGRTWSEYRLRLAAHGPRFEAMGVRFYRSPEIPWDMTA